MKTSLHIGIKTAIAAFAASALLTQVFASTISWPVKIMPPGSCEIDWSTNAPPQSGTLTKSGSITFDLGANIDFTFRVQPGFKLIHVFKNLNDEINWVLSNNYRDSFGPVQKSHTIVAVCETLSPTGTFTGNYTDGVGLTSVVDITGNYSGEDPNNPGRFYDVDAAMDDSGKVSAMGTVTGITNEQGGSELGGQIGSMKTVDNTPYGSAKGSFKGTVDGKPAAASGVASGDAVLQTAVGGVPQAEGVAGGSATVDGEKTSIKPAAVEVDVPPQHTSNLKKGWGLRLVLNERTDAKGKKYIEASGWLRLSNGEYSRFAPTTVKYAGAKGYTVSFGNGQKRNTADQPCYLKDPKTGANKLDKNGNPIPLIDKKTKVKLSNLVFSGSVGSWTANSGNMTYQFLGQKGKGPLASFLQ